jgi:uncharacterized membrane protein YfcA
MSSHHAVLLFFAAAAGGALNSVAGGGTFVAFPALLFTGMPPVNANATCTVALWPGSLAGIGAYRGSLPRGHGRALTTMVALSLVGGGLGALTLLRTPQATFMRLVPCLLLAATLIFAFGNKINAALRSGMTPGSRRFAAGAALLQFLVAIYGGFFGAGMGILFLALLALRESGDIHGMNAQKNLLVSCVNGVAVFTFVTARAVAWPQAALMVAASISGGYGAGRYAQKVSPHLVRGFVILVGAAMTVYFFARTWTG